SQAKFEATQRPDDTDRCALNGAAQLCLLRTGVDHYLRCRASLGQYSGDNEEAKPIALTLERVAVNGASMDYHSSHPPSGRLVLSRRIDRSSINTRLMQPITFKIAFESFFVGQIMPTLLPDLA